VKFFGHLVTKNKFKSGATQTQDFCEKNIVLKLQDLEEVLLGNWHFFIKKIVRPGHQNITGFLRFSTILSYPQPKFG